VTLLSGTDFSSDLDLATITILKDVKVAEITPENCRVDYSDGSTRAATLTVGLYTPRTLASHLQAQMNITSSGWTVSYSDSTHKFTITKSSGTASLLVKSGTNASISVWKTLGYDGGADKTAALTYEADAVFYDGDPDKSHILRVTGKGYKDDVSGTYTGTANAMIETGESILRMLIHRILKKPLSIIDETSFLEARSRAPESLAIYLNESTTTKEVFDAIEYSNIGNIIVDGEGKVYYFVYIGDIPASIIDFYDRDYLSFEAEKSVSDVYTTMRVLHDQDPSTGAFEARAATDNAVAVRFGRPDIRELKTYIKYGSNAQAAAARLLELAKVPARKITFSSKGKLIDKKVGDKIRITRSRAMDANGKIQSLTSRIISIKHDYARAESTVSVVDDVVTVAGMACITACQSACETGCQESCQIVCQDSCESSCQNACESSCQNACEGACQGTCQLGCQTTCELVCQSTCEVSCESGCQTMCQTSCQTGCELSCQNCQTACQTGGCETGCQTCQTCEAGGCEGGCEACESCQTCQVCEGGTYEGCGNTCEVACEGTCMSNCQSRSESILQV